MTVKQTQCLLCWLGLYGGAIDGIRGPQTQAAEAAFRAAWGREPDKEALLAAIAGTEVQEEPDWWKDIRHFRREEFACKCGRYCDGWPGEMSEILVRAADRLRAHFGAAVTVSSGLRCPKHNANVGGASASRHMTGRAMDFRVAGKTSAQVLEYVKAQPELRYAYAIDSQYVHMDVQ